MNKIVSFFKQIFSKRKNLVIFAIVLIVGGFIGWKVLGTRIQQPQYQTARAERGTIVSSVNASGHVQSTNIMNVTTGASGIVKKVLVADGDTVTAGQKIAEITLDASGQQKNASAWSSYLSAKNSVDSAEVSLYTLQSAMFAANQKFMNDAVARGLATDDPTYIQQNADWLAAEAKYKNQKNVIEQAKASLNSSWLSYQSTSPIITAPISGTVSNVGIVEGMVLGSQAVSSTDQTATSSQRVAVIQNERNPIITVNLSEIDVPKIKIGQKATVTLDSLPDKTFTGKVVTVDRIGTTSNNVTSYPAIVQLDTSSPEVLPNMAANASIITDTKSDVLLVPSSAVQMQGDQSVVRVLRNGREQTIPVQVGISSDTQTEIISGISEGDEVITATLSTAQTQQGGRSVFGGGGFGGGALRPGGFGGGGNQRR
jgi:macrolide-specific efflux system membrane fusion protein